MRKIIRIKLSPEKSVLAIKISEDEYIDENGRKHISPQPEDIIWLNENEVNEVSGAFNSLLNAYAKKERLNEQLEKIKVKMSNADMEIREAIGELKHAQGILTHLEFADVFEEMLPEKLKEIMDDKGFYIQLTTPMNELGNHLYIAHEEDTGYLPSDFSDLHFLYTEYQDDSEYYFYDNAEEYFEYQRILNAYEKSLPIRAHLKSKLYISAGELMCASVYAIRLKNKLTREYAKELAKEITRDMVY